MKTMQKITLGVFLGLFAFASVWSMKALAGSGDKEVGVELSCTGSSCIQVGVRQPIDNGGWWTLYFYTASSTPITVEGAMQQAITPYGTAINYTASYYHAPAGYAAMIINGMPKSTTGNFGATENWSLCVNGKAANQGMSAMTVKNGDKVLWTYGTYPPNCNN